MARKEQQSAIALQGKLPPPSSTVHHHARSYGADIFAGFLCGVGLLIVIIWLIYFFGAEMGVKNPIGEVGRFFVNLIQLGLGMWGLFFFGGKVLKPILATWKEVQLSKQEAQIQLERIKQQQAQAQPIGNSRSFGPDVRKALIIQTVMNNAYNFIEKEDRNFTYRDRWPWARRQIVGMVIDGKPITELEAGKVSGWLQGLGIIKEDQVNLEQYPDMNAINRRLRQEYDMPIIRGLPYSTDNNYLPTGFE